MDEGDALSHAIASSVQIQTLELLVSLGSSATRSLDFRISPVAFLTKRDVARGRFFETTAPFALDKARDELGYVFDREMNDGPFS